MRCEKAHEQMRSIAKVIETKARARASWETHEVPDDDGAGHQVPFGEEDGIVVVRGRKDDTERALPCVSAYIERQPATPVCEGRRSVRRGT